MGVRVWSVCVCLSVLTVGKLKVSLFLPLSFADASRSTGCHLVHVQANDSWWPYDGTWASAVPAARDSSSSLRAARPTAALHATRTLSTESLSPAQHIFYTTARSRPVSKRHTRVTCHRFVSLWRCLQVSLCTKTSEHSPNRIAYNLCKSII